MRRYEDQVGNKLQKNEEISETKDMQSTNECLNDSNPITKEDFDIITNQVLYAFKNAVNSLKTNPTSEKIEEIHLILLHDQTILSRLMKTSEIIDLLSFLNNKDLYTGICILLADGSHHNHVFSNFLVKNYIFSYLDFNEKVSFNLVFSICDNNAIA